MYTITTEKYSALNNTFTHILTEPTNQQTVDKALLFTSIGKLKPVEGIYRHTINQDGKTIATYNVACFDFGGYLQQLTRAAVAKSNILNQNSTQKTL